MQHQKLWSMQAINLLFQTAELTSGQVGINHRNLDMRSSLKSLGMRRNQLQSSNRSFQIKTQQNAVYVMSHLGCFGRLAGSNSPLLHTVYTGTQPKFRWLLLRVHGKYQAVWTPIQNSSISLFNSGNSNSVRICLTLDRAVGYHQVHEGLNTIGEQSSRAS